MIEYITSANATASRLLGKKTASNYKSKLRVISQFLLSVASLADFVQDEKLSTNLTLEAVQSIFGHLASIKIVNSENISVINETVSESYNSSHATLSVSTMQGYKSALLWHYKANNTIFPDTINSWIDQFIAGYKREVAKKKEDGIMRASEGRSPLTYKGYSLLCDSILKSNVHFSESTFGWSFMTLLWNMMSRSYNAAAIMFSHLRWEGDCMVVSVGRTKTDQCAESQKDKHVYANPLQPEVCPVLALAVYIFTRHRPTTDGPFDNSLFQGTENAQSRFCKILEKHIGGQRTEDFGGAGATLGAHSLRKGSATYVLGLNASVSAFRRIYELDGPLVLC